MKLGIIGLPLSGKTTLFNALTGRGAQKSAASHKSNFAVIPIPDERLDFLWEKTGREKDKVPATVTFVDFLAAKESESLALMHEMDGLLFVLRAFKIPGTDAKIEPLREAAEIEIQLILTDTEIVQKRLKKLEQMLTKPIPDHKEREKEQHALSKVWEVLKCDNPVRLAVLTKEEELLVRGFQFLSGKPYLLLLNASEEFAGKTASEICGTESLPDAEMVVICGKLEMEISQLPKSDQEVFLGEYGIKERGSDAVLRYSYKVLDMISFLTIGKDEVRAWSVKRGSSAVEAAGNVHTDMARGFIRAEVVSFDDFKSLGSIKDARAHGKARLEGKDYIVADGDIIEFRFSV
jgi:GTP-binding protein YchF